MPGRKMPQKKRSPDILLVSPAGKCTARKNASASGMIVKMQTTASSMVEIAQIVPERSRWYCDQLERGKILFFAGIPLDFSQSDCDFLLSQKQTGSRFHKNISYRPAKDILKGVSSDSPDRERLQR